LFPHGLPQVGKRFHFAVIEMAAGEKVKQVTDGLHSQLAKSHGKIGADPLCDRD